MKINFNNCLIDGAFDVEQAFMIARSAGIDMDPVRNICIRNTDPSQEDIDAFRQHLVDNGATIIEIGSVDPEVAIEKLWVNCNTYQENRIKGGALILANELKNAGNVKGQACYDWVQALWTDYYTRRAEALTGVEPSYDFSNNGELPYTVQELMAE